MIVLVFLSLFIPAAFWSKSARSPRRSPSLREFANRLQPEGDVAGAPEGERPTLTGAGVRFAGKKPGEVLKPVGRANSETGPRAEQAYDVPAMAAWKRVHAPEYVGEEPLTLDDYLYHDNSPIGVSIEAARFVDRETFTIDSGQRYRAYFGILHGHTIASDGRGTPDEAFTVGRDIAHLDFLAITDHAEAWRIAFSAPHPWDNIHELARKHSRPGAFAALPGFEYSSTVWGHFTVLNTKNYRDSINDFSLWDFYGWLNHPDQENALVFFNHPGFHGYRRPFEFLHFQLVPALRNTIVGMEVLHRNSAYEYMRGYSQTQPYLDEALAKGWMLGAVGGQDNHRGSWGLQDPVRIGLLLPELTDAAIYDAIRARRFYATQQEALQFIVEARGEKGPWHIMGESIPAEEDGDRPIEVRVAFAEPSGLVPTTRLEVVAMGQVIGIWDQDPSKSEVASRRLDGDHVSRQLMERLPPKEQRRRVAYSTIDPTNLPRLRGIPKYYPQAGEWRFELSRGSTWAQYFYVRLYQGGDSETFTQSSPIWLAARESK